VQRENHKISGFEQRLADQVHITNVLFNLLDNSVKYARANEYILRPRTGGSTLSFQFPTMAAISKTTEGYLKSSTGAYDNIRHN
jgi:hypothetical protein